MLCLVTTGCTRRQAPEIVLELGSTRFSFVPESAFAEYYELSGESDRLRLTFASYKTGCDRYVPPAEGEVIVTVTLRVPPGEALTPAEFSWKGLGEEPRNATEKDALPFVRLAREGRLLDPGGLVRLALFEKNPFGRVEGTLEFQGKKEEGGASTGALRGDFKTRLCRVSLDPGRVKVASPR